MHSPLSRNILPECESKNLEPYSFIKSSVNDKKVLLTCLWLQLPHKKFITKGAEGNEGQL